MSVSTRLKQRLNVAVGTRQACHERASDGSNTYPDLIVYTLSARGSRAKQGAPRLRAFLH